MGHRESRAADRLYRYTMRRTPQTIPATSTEIVEAFEKIRKETVGELAWNGEINIDIDEYHETVLRLAKRYHFDYERMMRDADQ